MRMIDIIAGKRSGNAHSLDEINYIINGITNGIIPDYQISAWLMAICFNGMNIDESSMLTNAMADSGNILDLSEIGEFVVDKHSTGGVGDKTTLILIPLLAAAGIPVAKLSGRGLGHTGGTIDKLESIPGFKTSLELDEFLAQVKDIGAAIASQTNQLAPADGKLYALRDVTATIESIPLIAASVVSKKIAAGANVIVLDVKCGSGAFMKTLLEAQDLSNTMVEIGKRLNKSISVVITSMEQPLGNAVGNSLEVIESIQTLKNQGPEDLKELCLILGAVTLVKLNKAETINDAKRILNCYLEDGSAYNKFKEIVRTQGGDDNAIDNIENLPASKYVIEIKSENDGYIKNVDALNIAKACKFLGAGRMKKGDNIDHAVGIVLNKKIGDEVLKEEILAFVHANSQDFVTEAINLVKKAYNFSETAPKLPELVYEILL
ncbi:MAG: thymidine phosphorylase [Candidatus Gastranaerophilales bacterium]|nr:thymidine phosphorylase [Candidatus Gastranaerophilales bacterium]